MSVSPIAPNAVLTINIATKRRENHFLRFFLAYYLLALHFILSVGMVIFMVTFVNKRLVNSSDEGRRSQRMPYFRASDITTLVSVGLTIVRTVSAAWTTMCTWRCAFILLETDGLTLREFNHMVSWRVLWPAVSIINLSVSLVLLAMLPSIFVAPVLSGAVDWRDRDVVVRNQAVRYDNPIVRPDDQWYWFLDNIDNRKIFVKRASGFSTVAWTNPNTAVRPCRHVMNSMGWMPANSTVENATIPCLVVHGISWNNSPEKTTTDIINDSSEISIVGDHPLGYHHQGLGVAFSGKGGKDWIDRYKTDRRNQYNRNTSTVNTPAPAVFSGIVNIAILISSAFERNCSAMDASMFGNNQDLLLQNPGLARYRNGYGGCFLTGTANITAGITRRPSAAYISTRVIEPESEGDIMPDKWVIPAVQVLPDIMHTVSVMNATSLEPWNDITGYTTRLIQQSYSGIWDAMNEDFNKGLIELTAREKVRVLQAIVSFPRVVLWFVAQGLVSISGIVLWILQQRCARSVIIDAAAVSLMVDASRVLEVDHGCLTNMSYVKSDDCSGLRLRLAKKFEENSYGPRFQLDLDSKPENGGYERIR